MATRGFGFPNCGGIIDGRHISIIALSEHHVFYMSRKGWSLRYYAGEPFHQCVHRIAWTRAWRHGSGKLISIAEVRKRYYS